MKAIKCDSVVVILFSVLVLALVTLGGPVQAQKADRPGVNVGDRRRFEVHLGTGPSATRLQNLSRVVTSVTVAGIGRTDNGLKVVLTQDLNEIEILSYKHSDRRLLSIPLEVGKQWHRTDNSLPKFVGKENRTDLSMAVVGYERVRVPAGEFYAFKPEAKGSWIIGSKTGDSTWTYWYAPAARGVVKSESQDTSGFTTMDLAEFHLQPRKSSSGRMWPTLAPGACRLLKTSCQRRFLEKGEET